jgi:hypothetical protein
MVSLLLLLCNLKRRNKYIPDLIRFFAVSGYHSGLMRQACGVIPCSYAYAACLRISARGHMFQVQKLDTRSMSQ